MVRILDFFLFIKIKRPALAGMQRGPSREYSFDSYAGITRIRFEGPKHDCLISADECQHPLCFLHAPNYS